MQSTWKPLETDDIGTLGKSPEPIEALIRGDCPAVVQRGTLSPAQCRSLVHRLIGQDLMFESGDDRVEQLALSAEKADRWTRRGTNTASSQRRRIDIGTSLGNYGDDQEDFFRRSAETHHLFDRLFALDTNPVTAVHESLQKLVPSKRVITAREPDGRLYGPAIFRVHYGGYTYPPHFDSVRNRECRQDYTVFQFDHQLAGVLCVQNASDGQRTAQGIIHRQAWTPALDSVLASGRFREYAEQNNIPHAVVSLEPGDLYFFNTGMIHEVPGVEGKNPRVVLATFIGYRQDIDTVMVWS